jgi:predicted dehydrogenase/nucleoside-diphosphate-sugar epimerase
MNMKGLRILLLGHGSFAATGLVPVLRRAGHTVTCYSRAPSSLEDESVAGSVLDLRGHVALRATFDAVINFVVLKNDSVLANESFARELLAFCRERSVPRLIHISSVSVHSAKERQIREDTAVETDLSRKGVYGAWKVAAERILVEERPSGLALTLIRPGFILGGGLLNPMPGIGIRLPSGHVLALGNARSILPVIGREQVHQAVLAVLSTAAPASVERLLLVAPNSPTRQEYLDACCKEIGVGNRVISVAPPIWRIAGIAGELLFRMRGKKHLYAKIDAMCRRQRFESAATEARLGTALSLPWRSSLRDAMDGQDPPSQLVMPQRDLVSPPARRICFVGYGRIVKQRHLPALRRVRFAGELGAYDLSPVFDSQENIQVRSIDELTNEHADLYVVATPGKYHSEVLARLQELQGAVLVEKPLCTTAEDLKSCTELAAKRGAPVVVCHNYRFKDNVRRMSEFLAAHNPGALQHVHVDFSSPPVRLDSAAWMRDERSARTLLLDYGLHFLDLGLAFSTLPRLVAVRHEPDANGATKLIAGEITGTTHSTTFVLRQGFGRRTATVTFSFQNYTVALGFFPDTCTVRFGSDNPVQLACESAAMLRAVAGKAWGRINQQEADLSHALMYSALNDSRCVASLSISALTPVYDCLFSLASAVYGTAPTTRKQVA